MKFLSLLVSIHLVLGKCFKLNEVGIYIFLIIKHFSNWYYNFLTHLVLEIQKSYDFSCVIQGLQLRWVEVLSC